MKSTGHITKEKVRQRVYEMLGRSIAENIEPFIDRALRCGALDLLQYGDNYMLPKIILTAIFEELADDYRPLGDEEQAEIDNLRKFL